MLYNKIRTNVLKNLYSTYIDIKLVYLPILSKSQVLLVGGLNSLSSAKRWIRMILRELAIK